jgi:hypothetical protein
MVLTVNSDGMMTLSKGRLELFVAESYMGRSTGVISGNIVTTLGLLPYRYYDKTTDEKPSEVGTLNIPSLVEFHPTSINTGQNIKIYEESDDKEYTVMSFDANTSMWSSVLIKSLNNVSLFIDCLLNGRLDNNIPYDMLSKAWLDNTLINDMSLNIPMEIFEMIIATLCRDKKTGKRFGELIGKDPNHTRIGYVYASLREVCTSSVFAALTFEDQNSMLDAAINMTLSGEEQKLSPIEPIIKF